MRSYVDTKLLLSEGLWGENEGATDIYQDATHNIFKEFTEKEVAAIIYRFGERLTYSQIGLKLGVTRQRVHQILHKALSKLKHPLRSGENIRKVDSNDIDNLGLTIRSRNALKNAGINKISELDKMTDNELLLIKNLGLKLLSEIQKSLSIYRMER